jgi:nucleoid DNA-binding protein
MNKAQFITYMSEQNDCTKAQAEKTIDMFVSSAMHALGSGEEISLVGFGNFSSNSKYDLHWLEDRDLKKAFS